MGYLSDVQRDSLGSVLEVTVGTGSGSMTHFLCVFFLFYPFRAGISVFPIHLTAPECITAFFSDVIGWFDCQKFHFCHELEWELYV